MRSLPKCKEPSKWCSEILHSILPIYHLSILKWEIRWEQKIFAGRHDHYSNVWVLINHIWHNNGKSCTELEIWGLGKCLWMCCTLFVLSSMVWSLSPLLSESSFFVVDDASDVTDTPLSLTDETKEKRFYNFTKAK